MDIKNPNHIIGHVTACLKGVDSQRRLSQIFIYPEGEELKELKSAIIKAIFPKAKELKILHDVHSEDDRCEKHLVTLTFEAIIEKEEEKDESTR